MKYANQFRKKKHGLTVAILGLSTLVYGQNFNYEYRNADDFDIVEPKGKSLVEMDAQCGVATVNSIENDNGYNDFQLTLLKATGDIYGIYRFGNPTRNEICNGVCKSLDYADQYLLCGKSSNNEMLITKVDDQGNIIWSKEIAFSGDESEAITIFQVNNNAATKGYVVVGNVNSSQGTNSVGAAKIDENGTLVWSAEYTLGNKLQMTDAIARANFNDRVVSITGFMQLGDIFYLNIYESNGAIFYYPGATYQLANPELLYRAQLTEIVDNGEKATVITFGRNALSANSVGIYALRTNGYDDFSVNWSKYYAQPGQHGYINSDLITLSTDRVSLMGGVNTFVGGTGPVQLVNPYILNIAYDGSLSNARDFDPGEYEFSGSIIESCNSGFEAFNAFNLEYGVQWDIKVIKQDSPGIIDCEDQLTWDAYDVDLDFAPLNMTISYTGTISDYDMISQDVVSERFNCYGNPMAPIHNDYESTYDDFNKDEDGSEIAEKQTYNTGWFYPNPANEEIQLQLTEASVEVQIYNASGQLILFGTFAQNESINVSQLPTGVYFVAIIDQVGDRNYDKLIIER